MKAYVLRNARSGAVVARAVARASNPLSRLLGLLSRGSVAGDEGLWIDDCNAVHTLGMRATLDLYFLDGEQCVLKIAPGVPPNRLAEMCRAAKTVVELGSAGTRDIELGDRLALE